MGERMVRAARLITPCLQLLLLIGSHYVDKLKAIVGETFSHPPCPSSLAFTRCMDGLYRITVANYLKGHHLVIRNNYLHSIAIQTSHQEIALMNC